MARGTGSGGSDGGGRTAQGVAHRAVRTRSPFLVASVDQDLAAASGVAA
jgi:hypothetical protein